MKEFTKEVNKSEREIAIAFTKNLLSFIIGRKPNPDDRKKIEKIIKATAKKKYRTQDIYAQIIKEYVK